jgi:hypothetical protein
MKNKIKVVMLPTEDKLTSAIMLGVTPGVMRVTQDKDVINDINDWMRFGKPQHLYITVSQDVEPIKEGDNIFNKHMNRLEIASKNCEINLANDMHYNEGKTRLRDNILKIIATTDPKLITYNKRYFDKNKERRSAFVDKVNIPQVQQSFLKEFVANHDGEWEVEYEEKQQFESADDYDYGFGFELKLNQDNTVNITSVEDKMYSKEDIWKTVVQSHIAKESMNNVFNELPDWFDNFIKENL